MKNKTIGVTAAQISTQPVYFVSTLACLVATAGSEVRPTVINKEEKHQLQV